MTPREVASSPISGSNGVRIPSRPSSGTESFALDVFPNSDSISDASMFEEFTKVTYTGSTDSRNRSSLTKPGSNPPDGCIRSPVENETAIRRFDNGHAVLEATRAAPIIFSITQPVNNEEDPAVVANLFPDQLGVIGLQYCEEKRDENVVQLVDNTLIPLTKTVVANMDMPWSTFICGSQGAGKSHTLSCLLENGLLPDNKINHLPSPLAGMVFHYDNYTNRTCSQVCEAAYLCSSGIPVTVLVSPSNIWAMTDLYSNLPGLAPGCPQPKVLPLYLSEGSLDISTMLKLMAIDPTAENVPLYMETVMSILREMAMEGKGAGEFSYAEFRARIDDVHWVPGQRVPLDLRLQLLDSFLEPSQFTRSTRPAPAPESIWNFKPGTLTIVDLSDPFVGSNDACSLFSICLSMFLEDRYQCGRVVALDEAHKFLSQSGAARALTADLTSVIRQQRHTGTRVYIATQEPTLSPALIDLCNVTFVHRFLSPAWYETLKRHLAGAWKSDQKFGKRSLFDDIVALETGEALLFCPTAIVLPDKDESCASEVEKLGSGFARVRIRERITHDGGKSILATETAIDPAAQRAQREIPMHIVAKKDSSASKPNHRDTRHSKQKDNENAEPTPPAPNSIWRNQMSTARPLDSNLSHALEAGYGSASNLAIQPVIKGDLSNANIEAAVRQQMRRDYKDLGWRSVTDISWKRFTVEVELALGQSIGSLKKQPKYRQIIRGTGLDEHERCCQRNPRVPKP